jgi:hypothetical protein
MKCVYTECPVREEITEYYYKLHLLCIRGVYICYELYLLLSLLSFGAESFVFQFAVQKFKD